MTFVEAGRWVALARRLGGVLGASFAPLFMLTTPYTAVLADLLYAHCGEFVGIYELALGWFTHVNPAGVQLLAYPSEAAFIGAADHSLRTPPWMGAQGEQLCEQARREGSQEVEADIWRHTGEPFRGYLKLISFEVSGQPLLGRAADHAGRKQSAQLAAPATLPSPAAAA